MIETFDDFISPLTKNDFLENYLGKKFCLFKKDTNQFGYLLDWANINFILNTHRLEIPRLRLVQDGKGVEEYLYIDKVKNSRGISLPIIKHEELAKLISKGATLIIDGINEMHKPVYDLASIIERNVSESVQANVYIAVCDNQGFGLHWDSHDVFVVQVSGKKHWRVFNQTRKHPLYNDIIENSEIPSHPIWEGILNEGDMLYLPRGWWHEAIPLNEQTVHLSFGLTSRTGIEVLDWFKNQFMIYDEFRADIPKHNSDAIYKHQKTLKKIILDYLESDFLHFFLEDTNGAVLPKGFNNSLDVVALKSKRIDDSISVKIAINRPLNIKYKANHIHFKALNKKWSFHKDLGYLFENISTGKIFTVQELLKFIPESIPHSIGDKILFELIYEGLLIKH